MFKPYMRYYLPVIATGLFILLFSSCKDKKDDYTFDLFQEYYPIDTGHYVIYDVDSTLYIAKGNSVTSHYQQMEVITDTLYDNEDDLNQVITVYRRADNTMAWDLDRVWFFKITNTDIQKNENAIRFIKLVFPPEEGKEWNGNAYVANTNQFEIYKDWLYSYSKVHQPYTINGFSFDSTLTVTGIDDSTNVIEKTLFREVYAKNVGMVYREWEVLKKQDVTASWETGTEEGFKIRMKVAGHN